MTLTARLMGDPDPDREAKTELARKKLGLPSLRIGKPKEWPRIPPGEVPALDAMRAKFAEEDGETV